MARWSAMCEAFRRLEQKRVYIERHGDDNGFKAKDVAAFGEILDMLAEILEYADDVAEAPRLVAERPPTAK